MMSTIFKILAVIAPLLGFVFLYGQFLTGGHVTPFALMIRLVVIAAIVLSLWEVSKVFDHRKREREESRDDV